jgi:hypothetical protein
MSRCSSQSPRLTASPSYRNGVEEERITPLFDSRCTLDELPQVLAELESGERHGKVLIEVNRR